MLISKLFPFAASFLAALSPVSREMTIKSNPGTVVGPCSLGATILRPENPKALIIFVHGSGVSDRDERIGARTPFKDIAEGLADQGFASLRFDKRGTQTDCRPALMRNPALSPWHFIEDVRNVIRTAVQQSDLNTVPLILLGHSEGVNSVAEITSTHEFNVKGLILIAGLGHYSIDETILRQFREQQKLKLPASDQAKLEQVIASGAAFFQKLRSKTASSNEFWLGQGTQFWTDWITITERAARTVSKLRVPILVVHGSLDQNVTLEDFEALKAASSSVAGSQSVLIDGIDHLLTRPSETRVDRRVVDAIELWLNRVTPTQTH